MAENAEQAPEPINEEQANPAEDEVHDTFSAEITVRRKKGEDPGQITVEDLETVLIEEVAWAYPMKSAISKVNVRAKRTDR